MSPSDLRTLVFCLASTLCVPLAHACTTFAANGEASVAGGGSLIAKVRDEFMTEQVVKTVRPTEGYAYTGLFVGKRRTFNMGVNEKGFVVFRTTAGSVPKAVRRQARRFRSPDGLSGQEFLIRHSDSVEAALRHTAVFRHEPTHYVMADRKEIAFVEVFPDGRYSVTRRKNGVLAHTNHYVSEEGSVHNTRIGRSSRIRLQRIETLLDRADKPLSLEDFVRMSEDRNDGPHDSIFRSHDNERRPSTLSVLVVHLPETGSPELYLKWRDSPENKRSWKNKRHSVHFEAR